MGEENDQVELTVSPVRGLGPGPATLGPCSESQETQAAVKAEPPEAR